MGEKTNFKTRVFYANIGTKENPQWEKLNNPFDRVEIFETRWEKAKRFIKKLLHLDKQK